MKKVLIALSVGGLIFSFAACKSQDSVTGLNDKAQPGSPGENRDISGEYQADEEIADFSGINCEGLSLWGDPVSYKITPYKLTVYYSGYPMEASIDGEKLYFENKYLVVGSDGKIPLHRCMDGINDAIMRYIP